MPDRQSRHSDNALIDDIEATPSGKGSAGGQVKRNVGSRAELKNASSGNQDIERPTGKDNPRQDASKGPRSSARLRQQRG